MDKKSRINELPKGPWLSEEEMQAILQTVADDAEFERLAARNALRGSAERRGWIGVSGRAVFRWFAAACVALLVGLAVSFYWTGRERVSLEERQFAGIAENSKRSDSAGSPDVSKISDPAEYSAPADEIKTEETMAVVAPRQILVVGSSSSKPKAKETAAADEQDEPVRHSGLRFENVDSYNAAENELLAQFNAPAAMNTLRTLMRINAIPIIREDGKEIFFVETLQEAIGMETLQDILLNTLYESRSLSELEFNARIVREALQNSTKEDLTQFFSSLNYVTNEMRSLIRTTDDANISYSFACVFN